MKKSCLFVVAFAMIVISSASGAMAATCELPGNASELIAMTGQLMNAERSKNGRKALRPDPRLQAAAQAHACDMSVKGYFSHRGQNGSKPKRRLQAQGCRAGLVAENIAIGRTDPQQTMNEWMASPGHRKNILIGRGASQFGIGIAKAGRAYSHGYVWVMVLSRGC